MLKVIDEILSKVLSNVLRKIPKSEVRTRLSWDRFRDILKSFPMSVIPKKTWML